MPPPLNLVRAAILGAYAQLDKQCGRRASERFLGAMRRLVGATRGHHARRGYAPLLAEGDDDGSGGGGSHASSSPVPGGGRWSRGGEAEEEEAELDSDQMSEGEVAKQVGLFLRKATDTQVQMMPEGVEQYVLRHQHDVAREVTLIPTPTPILTRTQTLMLNPSQPEP